MSRQEKFGVNCPMELESPADAWYVWAGVAVVSVAVAGIVLGLPTEPAPDADQAANAIDRVGTSQYGASASYEHTADEVRIGTKQIALRNDGGTSHASIAVGSLTPVFATEGELHHAASALLAGESTDRIVAEHRGYDTEADLRSELEAARLQHDRDGADWRPADGDLRVRAVTLDGETVVLIDA